MDPIKFNQICLKERNQALIFESKGSLNNDNLHIKLTKSIESTQFSYCRAEESHYGVSTCSVVEFHRQYLTSRIQRPRQLDYNKQVIIINDTDQFNSIDQQYNDYTDDTHTSLTKRKSDKSAIENKNNIIIPSIQTVKNENNNQIKYNEPKQKQKRHYECYIRIFMEKILPKHDIYERVTEDVLFLEKLNEKSLDNSQKLTVDKFEKVIQILESNSKREAILTLQEAKLHCIELLDKNVITKLDQIYEYWKSQRETLKRPLIRKYIRPSPDDVSPYVAFRPREKDKMKLRRSNRANDIENLFKLKTLRQEMDFARNMLEQIKLREQVKYQLIESNIIKIDEFKCEKTEIVNLTPQYKQIIESTNKYIQDIKRLQIKNNKYLLQVQQMSEINQTQRPPVLDSQKKVIKNFLQKPLKSSSNSLQIQDNNSDSLNFDIAAFLSSIILEANFHDITIEKIQKPELLNQKKERHQIKNDDNKIDDILHKKQDLYGENGIYPNLKNQFSANSTSTVMKSIDNQNKGQSLKKNILSFKIRKRLSRGGRFLIDKYFEDNEEIPIQKDLYYNTKPYQENYIIQQKLQKFQNISSFSDYDEEDFNETARIMKKNIQTGFKNFQKQRKAQVVVTN